MLKRLILMLTVLLMLPISAARADEYTDTLNLFKNAGQSGSLLHSAYGYAVFPKIGKGGVGIGGAHGKGRVYEKGKRIGDTSMTQLTVGLQLGGQVYSELIVFEDERALKEFTNGNFEFGADANAIAITAAAGAQAGTTGHVYQRQWRPERCQNERRLSKRCGCVYSGQGWADVRGKRWRTEVLLQASLIFAEC